MPDDPSSGDAGTDRPGPDAAPPREPRPSGIDLAKALLAQVKADARAAGRRAGSASSAASGPARTQAERARRAEAAATRSGAGPDDRDPQPLGRAVDRLRVERGWQEALAAGSVLDRWADVVGPDVAAHTTAEAMADGVLTVRAESSAWATQLRLLAPELVRRLNEACGQGSVGRVVVLGPGRPSWRKGRLHVPGRGPRDTYG